jgi:hypothetical protein
MMRYDYVEKECKRRGEFDEKGFKEDFERAYEAATKEYNARAGEESNATHVMSIVTGPVMVVLVILVVVTCFPQQSEKFTIMVVKSCTSFLRKMGCATDRSRTHEERDQSQDLELQAQGTS